MAMAMSPGPMAQRLSRFRMPMQGSYPRPQERMSAMNPEMMDEDMVRSGPYDQGDAGIEMPPGQGDMGTEIMAGEQQREEPMPIGQPGAMGPVGARITQVHSPAEANAQRGYAQPGLDSPRGRAPHQPYRGGTNPLHAVGPDANKLHSEQHKSFARSAEAESAMLSQQLVIADKQAGDDIAMAKSEQDLARANQRREQIRGMIRALGLTPSGPGE